MKITRWMQIHLFAAFVVALSVSGHRVVAQDATTVAQIIQTVRENPENRSARWSLARIAFQAGNFDAARFHVQRLLRTSRSPADIETLSRALAEITAADPWNVELGFALLPSTNIRRNTYNTEFETLSGIFTPTGGGDEESGIGVFLSAGLSYQLALPDNARLTLLSRVNQRLYDTSDLNRTSVLFAVRRDTFAVGRQTAVEPYVRLTYDENQDIDRRDLGVRLSTGFYFGEGAQLNLSSRFEERKDFDNDLSDGPYGRIGLKYSFNMDDRTRLGFGFAVARFIPEGSHLRYIEGEVSADANRRFRDLGSVGIFGRYAVRQYDDVFPLTTLVREDEKLAVGMSFQPSEFEVFGVRPKVSCQIEQNSSNIALYDYNSTDCRLTFDRSF